MSAPAPAEAITLWRRAVPYDRAANVANGDNGGAPQPYTPVNIADIRREYHRAALTEADVDADPVRQFERWLSEAMRAAVPGPQARDWALAAGDDYELLLAVPAPRYAELAAEAHQLNLTLTAIGELHAGDGVTWSLNGKEFAPGVRGWDHFA